MKKKLVFRADGNTQIGLGHVVRCLALAEILIDDFDIAFAIQNPDSKIEQLINETGIKTIIKLPQTSDYQDDIQNLILYIEQLKDIIFIIDGYFFKSDYQKQLKAHCQKLVFIDDLFAWHQYADIVINHSGVVKESDYEAEPYTKFLLGTQYALIRKEFWKHSSSKDLKFPFQKILVNLGGADSNNYSYDIVKTLFHLNNSLEITLLLGAANKNLNTFGEFQGKKLLILQNITSKKVAQNIENCDLAIVSCSTIAYEVSIVGKPFIGILTAKNQNVYKHYFKQLLAIDVIEPQKLSSLLLKDLFTQKDKALQTIENQKEQFSQSNLKTTLKQLL